MMKGSIRLAAAAALVISCSAGATTLTETSLTSKGAIHSGISAVGGIVVDMVGVNGTRVETQLAASELFVGFFDSGSPSSYNGNPGTIGIQTGFDSSVTSALGGGLAEMAIRLTVWDGDTSMGNFDYNQNTLLVNDFSFGNFSDVTTDVTDNTGTTSFSTELGFDNDSLNTGWFYSSDSTLLNDIFASIISTETIVFGLFDEDPYDNYFDFTLGLDSSLVNVGTGPVVGPTNPAPAPASLGLLALGLLAAGVARRRRIA